MIDDRIEPEDPLEDRPPCVVGRTAFDRGGRAGDRLDTLRSGAPDPFAYELRLADPRLTLEDNQGAIAVLDLVQGH